MLRPLGSLQAVVSTFWQAPGRISGARRRRPGLGAFAVNPAEPNALLLLRAREIPVNPVRHRQESGNMAMDKHDRHLRLREPVCI